MHVHPPELDEPLDDEPDEPELVLLPVSFDDELPDDEFPDELTTESGIGSNLIITFPRNLSRSGSGSYLHRTCWNFQGHSCGRL